MIHVAEHWFESEGTRLYAVERGHGQPIVFLHGGLADHRAAVHAVGQLGASFRLITPDLRGSGRSHDAGPLSWDRLADGVAALLDQLGLERAVIGGTSAGSAVALRFALRWPKRCAGLLLVSPLYPGEQLGLAEAPRLAMERMDAYAQRALREGVAALFPLFEGLPEAIRERALAMVASFDLASVAAFMRLLASGQQPFASLLELRRIEVPTLVVPGIDPQHPTEVASLYATNIPKCRVGDAAALVEAIERFCSDAAQW
ncbi:MAG TPA: alpha/beta hydrolase [Enhygromyxa sp.]|nr:alpha/beta hydrolase [Enhygromyxa sp.]